MDRLKLSYKQFFPSPFLQTERAEMQFTDLLTTIGSWPQVEFFPDFVRSQTQTLRTRRNMCWCPWSCSSAQTCWTWSRGGGWRTASSSLPHYSRNTSVTSRFPHNSRGDLDWQSLRHSADPEVARSRFTSGMQLVTKCKELHAIISNNRINLDVL